jgi:hypothetical protein
MGCAPYTAGTEVVRIHDQHSVTIECEDGSTPHYTSVEEAKQKIKNPKSVIFESKPAIAPKGTEEMPFATVTFAFTQLPALDGRTGCKVSAVTLPLDTTVLQAEAVLWCHCMLRTFQAPIYVWLLY